MHHEAAKAVESAAVLMRIQILSDLHLEFRGNTLPPLAPDAELIILAGDLAPVPAGRVGEAARRWAGAERILYVPGNTSTTARRLTSRAARSRTSAGATR